MSEKPGEWWVSGNDVIPFNWDITWTAAAANDLVHETSFSEWKSIANQNHLLCDEKTANRMLAQFWISVWDTIVKEYWRGIKAFKIKGIAYNFNHQWDTYSKAEAQVKFQKAITELDLTQMSLCINDQRNPDNFSMIWLSTMEVEDSAIGLFSLRDQEDTKHVAYMKADD